MVWTLRQKQLLIDYKMTFNTEHGRRVLADIAKQCWVNQDIFDGDALTMAYREGQRSTALRVLRTLKMDSEAIENLITEEDDDVI
jgi:hypothetical protein